MQSVPTLGPGTLIADRARILELVFQDAFYAIYSAETPGGEKVGLTEYFPADLAARTPNGEVSLRSLELEDLFNTGRERFITEAKALAALRHPNLLRFDGVFSDQGTAFALHAAEEGRPLIDISKSAQSELAQPQIDAFLKPLISALKLLHSQNLIHANITPGTILLRPDPLLIRFGAARSFLAIKMRKVNLGVTPGYSAPELHFSDEKAIGPRCDIFSLAAVLYFAVTGRHPISVIARGLGQTMPPTAAINAQNFRPAFLEAIDKGLELDPERRPPTIEAFGEMLFGKRERSAPQSTKQAPEAAALSGNGHGSSVGANPSPADKGSSMNHPGNVSAQGPEDEDDEDEEYPDFGGGWRGLGIIRLVALAAVLALLIPTGLWMLQGQFGKQPEKSARVETGNDAGSPSAGTNSSASQEPSSRQGDRKRLASAKPASQTSTAPTSAEPDARAATIERPRAPEPKADASQKTSGDAAATTGTRPLESAASEPVQRSTDLTSEAKPEAEEQEAKEPGADAMSSARPAAGKPTQGEPPTQVATAEPAPSPLLKVSATSPAGFKFRECAVCPELVVVGKGEFAMGADEHPDEKPTHKVKISNPFAIGQYEVTHAEWEGCVEAGACSYRPNYQGSPNDAIGNLSWDDANTYLKWLSEKTGQVYRLPSEAEWEYASRAGTAKPFWWGNEVGSGKANCADCGSGTNGKTAAVGSYKPNAFGLYDTSGNVAEWVADCWNESYKGAPADGSAWLSGNCRLRVLRGGYFGSKSQSIRPAARFRYQSDVRYLGNGFRVLRELTR